MLKIGEFSKLSQITVKALRFYEKEGLLIPAHVDEWTGYRFYETEQLMTAAKIKSYRCLDLSIDEIRTVFGGANEKKILLKKAEELSRQKTDIEIKLSVLKSITEGSKMNYSVTVKNIPEYIVYYSEKRLKKVSDKMEFIPMCGEECIKLNPDLKCVEPPYEYCEYLDDEFKETDVLIRHNEAVEKFGNESNLIKFRKIEPTKVLSILHKGAYESLGEAYAFIMKYAKENEYEISDKARECYIDGIWNKESPDDWLTEIQLPIK